MASPSPTTWERFARELGLELQRRRAAANLSQEALAHQAGMTRTHYQQIERGSWKPGQPANPSLKALAGLAIVLGVEIGDLLPSVGSLSIP